LRKLHLPQEEMLQQVQAQGQALQELPETMTANVP